MPLDSRLAQMSAADKAGFLVPLDSLKLDGKVLALPWEGRVWLLWYRRDLLEQARLAIPTTRDAMGVAGGKIANDHLMGFSFGASAAGLGAGVHQTLTPLLWAAGGDLPDKNGARSSAVQPG